MEDIGTIAFDGMFFFVETPRNRIPILPGIFYRDEHPSYHKEIDEKMELMLKIELRELK